MKVQVAINNYFSRARTFISATHFLCCLPRARSARSADSFFPRQTPAALTLLAALAALCACSPGLPVLARVQPAADALVATPAASAASVSSGTASSDQSGRRASAEVTPPLRSLATMAAAAGVAGVAAAGVAGESPRVAPLGTLISALVAQTALGATAGNAANAAESTDTDHASHGAQIHRHRMQRLQDKLTVAPNVLKESCRYESDISTSPPHKRVALTFDDGPDPGQTELILAVLKKHDISASFFLIGEKAQRYPQLVAAIASDGRHLVGNHSWNHPNFHGLAVADQSMEVQKADEVLAPVLAPRKLFRYPYGNSTCQTNALLKSQGYATVGWHVDSCDWAFDRSGSVDVKEATECGVLPQYRSHYVGHVLSAVRAHSGGIVLMHETHANTVKELDRIITLLLADGYEFGAINEPAFASSMR